jgi:hypothetical protein
VMVSYFTGLTGIPKNVELGNNCFCLVWERWDREREC